MTQFMNIFGMVTLANDDHLLLSLITTLRDWAGERERKRERERERERLYLSSLAISIRSVCVCVCVCVCVMGLWQQGLSDHSPPHRSPSREAVSGAYQTPLSHPQPSHHKLSCWAFRGLIRRLMDSGLKGEMGATKGQRVRDGEMGRVSDER